MVDPLFNHIETKKELASKISKYSGIDPVISENQILDFPFDFGNGNEKVRIEMVALPYPYTETDRKATDYQLPQNTGVVILYAPAGIEIDENKVQENLVSGGEIISEYTLTTAITKIDLGS